VAAAVKLTPGLAATCILVGCAFLIGLGLWIDNYWPVQDGTS
jgi:hypothetical protein